MPCACGIPSRTAPEAPTASGCVSRPRNPSAPGPGGTEGTRTLLTPTVSLHTLSEEHGIRRDAREASGYVTYPRHPLRRPRCTGVFGVRPALTGSFRTWTLRRIRPRDAPHVNGFSSCTAPKTLEVSGYVVRPVCLRASPTRRGRP